MSALQRIGSIKVKLGVLVVVAVVVTALVATLGAAAGVPVWLSLPVTVLLSLAVTQLLAAGMTAPLRDMTEASQRMSRGDYSARVVTPNTDEVGRLAAAFNVMAGDLASVDAERRDLIATVSHELRTPVAAISAQLENLVDGVVEADRAQLESVLASAERLGDLLGDLLGLSRLEAGVVELDPSEVVLADLVSECVDQVRAAGRRTDVVATVPPGMRVAADPVRVRQLLTNVLDNAARHSPDDAVVRVLAGTSPDGWWLEVLDEGPGVAPEDRERVFERFGTDATGGGTGLGLAISRWVARLHGGTLAFLDPVAGHAGARLRLEVPVVAGAPQAAAVAETGGDRTPEPRVTSAPGMAGVAPAAAPVGQTPRPVTAAHAPSAIDQAFGRRWPEILPEADLRVVGGAAAVGLLAGAVMTFSGPGLSWAVVLMAAGLCAWLASGRRTAPWTL
ncbi:MAG: ATP-binding protein, partial [Nocardioides sp.]|uniref:HAMP domain-containing sensor histidine kinase n=1 Tax=Nocardioides sp. TaxID=35761 RepID=UPI003F00034A